MLLAGIITEDVKADATCKGTKGFETGSTKRFNRFQHSSWGKKAPSFPSYPQDQQDALSAHMHTYLNTEHFYFQVFDNILCTQTL